MEAPKRKLRKNSMSLFNYCYEDPTLNHLLKEWHDDNKATPYQLARFSNQKAKWKCCKEHEWITSVCHRTGSGRSGCPFCSGNLPSTDQCLAVSFPDVCQYWNTEKNEKTPNDVMSRSLIKVWWKCEKEHEWFLAPNNVVNIKGIKCPICRKECRPIQKRNLGVRFPELCAEWHPTKNGIDEPKMFKPFSSQRVWWLCKNGHEWKAQISNRTSNNSGCPDCPKSISPSASLGKRFPDLMEEWDYENNEENDPTLILPTNRDKVWWRCKKEGHIWESTPYSRVYKKSGCHYCVKNGRLVSDKVCLQILCPEVAAMWHPTKNDKTPRDVTLYSHAYAWWKCEKGHEWNRKVCNEVSRKVHCSECKKTQRIPAERSLEVTHPDILKEWNYERNEHSPSTYSMGSHYKVWWKCRRDHEWLTTIKNKTSGSGCPQCRNSSIGERKIKKFCDERKIEYFQEHKFKNLKYKLHLRCDFYLPVHNVIIEYDGRQHWYPISYKNTTKYDIKNSQLRDKLKTEYAFHNKISLIRISYREFRDIDDILSDIFESDKESPFYSFSNTDLYCDHTSLCC